MEHKDETPWQSLVARLVEVVLETGASIARAAGHGEGGAFDQLGHRLLKEHVRSPVPARYRIRRRTPSPRFRRHALPQRLPRSLRHLDGRGGQGIQPGARGHPQLHDHRGDVPLLPDRRARLGRRSHRRVRHEGQQLRLQPSRCPARDHFGTGDPAVQVRRRLPGPHPTGLYHFTARYYDPNIGRFTSPDPSGQEKNPYLYAEGDPVIRIDPQGTLGLDGIGNALGVGTILYGGFTGCTSASAKPRLP